MACRRRLRSWRSPLPSQFGVATSRSRVSLAGGDCRVPAYRAPAGSAWGVDAIGARGAGRTSAGNFGGHSWSWSGQWHPSRSNGRRSGHLLRHCMLRRPSRHRRPPGGARKRALGRVMRQLLHALYGNAGGICTGGARVTPGPTMGVGAARANSATGAGGGAGAAYACDAPAVGTPTGAVRGAGIACTGSAANATGCGCWGRC